MTHFAAHLFVKKLQSVGFQGFIKFTRFACTRPLDFYFGKVACILYNICYFVKYILMRRGVFGMPLQRSNWHSESVAAGRFFNDNTFVGDGEMKDFLLLSLALIMSDHQEPQKPLSGFWGSVLFVEHRLMPGLLLNHMFVMEKRKVLGP